MKQSIVFFIIMVFGVALLTWAKAPINLNSNMALMHHECSNVANSSEPISKSYKEYLDQGCSVESGLYNSKLNEMASKFFVKTALSVGLISIMLAIYGYQYARSYKSLYSLVVITFILFFIASGLGAAIVLSCALGCGSYFAHKLSKSNNVT